MIDFMPALRAIQDNAPQKEIDKLLHRAFIEDFSNAAEITIDEAEDYCRYQKERDELRKRIENGEEYCEEHPDDKGAKVLLTQVKEDYKITCGALHNIYDMIILNMEAF